MEHVTDIASLKVEADASRDLLRITLSGFFDATMVRHFREARIRVLAELTCPPNGHLALVDVTGMKLQAQTVLPAFIEQISDPALKSRRIAFVIGQSLARMQLRRMTIRDDMLIAGSIAEAEAYLFPPEAVARTAAA